MRVGFAQFAPQHHRQEENLATIERLVRVGADADLLVLPELADSGYLFADRDELMALATAADGAVVSFVQSLSRTHDIALVVGFAERDGEQVFNSAVLTTPDDPPHIYRKVHLFDREMEIFDPGDRPFSVVSVRGTRVGLMICFDWVFPEAARSLALLGAQVIAHPSNLVLPHCQRAMVTRSLENRVFAVTANRIGREVHAGRSLTFTGESQVTSPSGERVAVATQNDESVVLADIDPEDADNKYITAANHVLVGRRPGLYVA